MSAGATDRFASDPEHVSIATTGRILKIDLKNRTLRVRGADGQSLTVRNSSSQSLSQTLRGVRQRIGVTLPGGITISLPGRGPKGPSKPAEDGPNLEEYTVVVTEDTVIQDGSDNIRLEDFRTGETISIHGVVNGNIVRASRIAKWMS
jgi:hypothetical protein